MTSATCVCRLTTVMRTSLVEQGPRACSQETIQLLIHHCLVPLSLIVAVRPIPPISSLRGHPSILLDHLVDPPKELVCWRPCPIQGSLDLLAVLDIVRIVMRILLRDI